MCNKCSSTCTGMCPHWEVVVVGTNHLLHVHVYRFTKKEANLCDCVRIKNNQLRKILGHIPVKDVVVCEQWTRNVRL